MLECSHEKVYYRNMVVSTKGSSDKFYSLTLIGVVGEVSSQKENHVLFVICQQEAVDLLFRYLTVPINTSVLSFTRNPETCNLGQRCLHCLLCMSMFSLSLNNKEVCCVLCTATLALYRRKRRKVKLVVVCLNTNSNYQSHFIVMATLGKSIKV